MGFLDFVPDYPSQVPTAPPTKPMTRADLIFPFAGQGPGEQPNTTSLTPAQESKRRLMNILNIGKDILQGTAREGGSLGVTLTGQKQLPAPDTSTLAGKFQKFIFGSEPVKSIPTRISEATPKVQNQAAKLNINLSRGQATMLAAPFIIGSTALNFTGFGGEEKAAVRALTLASKESDVVKILKNIGVADDLISSYKGILSKTFNETTVKDIISHIQDVQDATRTVTNYKLPNYLAKAGETVPKFAEEVKAGVTAAPQLDPETTMINAIQQMAKIRPLQESMYTAERAQRFAKAGEIAQSTSGEAGFRQELAALKGRLPQFKLQALRGRVPQETIDALLNRIKDSPYIGQLESYTARNSLIRLINEGKIPTEGEQALLNKVFSPAFMQAVTKDPSTWKDLSGLGAQIWNLPKAMMSSWDLSAPLRQGLYALPSYPKEFFKNFTQMFKYWGDEKAFQAGMDSIKEMKSYQAMRGRVAFTGLDQTAAHAEEAFYGGNLAEKIPGIGRGVRASERAYVGFLNKYRADIFDNMFSKLEGLGHDVSGTTEESKKLLDGLGEFVNTITGRGELPGKALKQASPFLNGVMFSPRLVMSRLQLMNPQFYYKLPAPIRQQALKSLLYFTGAAATVLGAAKMMGADVVTDPRNADFLKVKIGGTRFDVLGGFAQYIRTAAQEATQQTVSSSGTGVPVRLGEKLPGYESDSWVSPLKKLAQSKETPIFGLIGELMSGQTATGEDRKGLKGKGQSLLDYINPLIVQDLIQVGKTDPKLLPPAFAAALFGVGVQSYNPTVRQKGQVLPWNQDTKVLQYNTDTANEIKRYKARIKQAYQKGDEQTAQREERLMNQFINSRQAPPP